MCPRYCSHSSLHVLDVILNLLPELGQGYLPVGVSVRGLGQRRGSAGRRVDAGDFIRWGVTECVKADVEPVWAGLGMCGCAHQQRKAGPSLLLTFLLAWPRTVCHHGKVARIVSSLVCTEAEKVLGATNQSPAWDWFCWLGPAMATLLGLSFHLRPTLTPSSRVHSPWPTGGHQASLSRAHKYGVQISLTLPRPP